MIRSVKNELVTWGPFVASSALAVAIGYSLQVYHGIEPHLIWGGMDCETTGDIRACFGYPPTGIVFILFASACVVSVGVRILRGAWP